MKELRDAAVEALQEVQQLVKACNGKHYNQPCTHSESGIGRHVRHILDHFCALQDGLQRDLINYNCRHRDSSIEDNPTIALALIVEMQQWLMQADNDLCERAIKIETEVSLSQQKNMRFMSSLSRELCYLINHTVHHVAYAKLVAQHLGIEIDGAIGVAPSTASYFRQKNN